MKRAAFILLALFLASTAICRADDFRKSSFSFGLGWGFCPTFFQYHKFVYRDEYGSTVPDIGSGFQFEDDFFVLARSGITFGEKSTLSLSGGLMGIGDNRRCIPLLLGYNFAAGGMKRDGAIVFADGGAGFPLNTVADRPALIGRVGGGYRLVLDTRVFLDFSAGVNVIYDHPCEEASVRKNEAFRLGASIGVALGF